AKGGRSSSPDVLEGHHRVKELPARPDSRSLIRVLNVSLLIELVRRSGPVSRADLARQSQISAPTVSGIVRDLLNRGIFSEVALAPSSGGRPPILLELEPKAGYVVGIKLRGDGLTTVVCDLDGRVVVTTETTVALVGQPTVAIAAVAQATREALGEAGIARSKVLGVGVGLPGVIDSSLGVCTFSHLLKWEDVELARPLQQKMRLPIWVDNDVNTLAVAEKWAGGGIQARNFVTVSIGRGVGIGIVIDRAIYRGTAGGAGEFGHTVVDPDGPECECGRSGCLEALVGERALRRRLGERLGHDVSREELIDRAASQDPVATEVLALAGRELGLAIANVISLLAPELLIICGEGTELGEPFLGPAIAAARSYAFADLGQRLEVKTQHWGDDAWAAGAATLALRELFNLPGEDEQRRAIWNWLEA
ncbi:MAG: ROK family protein, partial [Acidimicrobiales bacterium]